MATKAIELIKWYCLDPTETFIKAMPNRSPIDVPRRISIVLVENDHPLNILFTRLKPEHSRLLGTDRQQIDRTYRQNI